MGSRTVFAVLASLALFAAPLAAQDTTTTRRDTTGAKPAPDTTGARHDTIAVIPAPADTTRRDTTVVAAPAVQPAADTTRRTDTTVAAPAQQDNAVRPGMTQAEVEARWGTPLAVRTANDWTYLFYRNAAERRVGYEDVVFLQRGQVMDAIVRSPDHVYTGVSSSPEGRVPVFTPPQGQPADSARGAAVTGVRVQPDQ
jgi:hypothetical protein